MGEAKRRKQRDASYGKSYDITSPRSLAHHLRKLFLEADQVWGDELGIHYDLEQADNKLAEWMQQQMSCFKAQDRLIMATALVTQYLDAGVQYTQHLSERYPQDLEEHRAGWGRMFQAIAKSLEPWLPEDVLQELNVFLEPGSDEAHDLVRSHLKVAKRKHNL
ncbi:MAG TPA: hypothetical protein V6D43_14240 [Candidatus Sericytochromatia bacterium]|jgi:hypothetical protein